MINYNREIRNQIRRIGTWLGITDNGWKEQPLYVAINRRGETIQCRSVETARYWLQLSEEVDECAEARRERQA